MTETHALAGAFPNPAEIFEVPGGGHNTVIDIGGTPLLDRIATFLDQAVTKRDAIAMTEGK